MAVKSDEVCLVASVFRDYRLTFVPQSKLKK